MGSNFGGSLAAFEAILGGPAPRLEAISLPAGRLRRQYWKLATPIASNMGSNFGWSLAAFEAIFEGRLRPFEAISVGTTKAELQIREAVFQYWKQNGK